MARSRGQRRSGNAETLRRYWSTGPGAAKIKWGTAGDYRRCTAALAKYMGGRARGYCALLHRRNTGVYPGSRANTGRRR